QHLDELGAVDNAAAQRAAGLEARKNHMAFLAPDVVFEVVVDPSAGAHAAAGDDDRADLDALDGHRLFRSWRAAQAGAPVLPALDVLGAQQGQVGIGEMVLVARVDGVGTDRPGAVEQYGLLRQTAFLVEAPKLLVQVEGTAN